jgi:hypothetical protein
MAQYGEVLGTYNPIYTKIYEDFDSYFNHPIMTKMYDQNGYSIYMTKTYCLLSTECRYIIAIILQNKMPIGSKEKLSELPWVSFQTRTLSENHPIQSHSYTPTRKGPLLAKIYKTSATPEAATYKCNTLPLIITLLVTKQSSSEYQNEGHLISALETYQTIITLE